MFIVLEQTNGNPVLVNINDIVASEQCGSITTVHLRTAAIGAILHYDVKAGVDEILSVIRKMLLTMQQGGI